MVIQENLYKKIYFKTMKTSKFHKIMYKIPIKSENMLKLRNKCVANIFKITHFIDMKCFSLNDLYAQLTQGSRIYECFNVSG